jgi:hypothetical protein
MLTQPGIKAVRRGNAAGTLAAAFKYLPPPIRDHLQDRYYNALT